jgi:hypothetical protein
VGGPASAVGPTVTPYISRKSLLTARHGLPATSYLRAWSPTSRARFQHSSQSGRRVELHPCITRKTLWIGKEMRKNKWRCQVLSSNRGPSNLAHPFLCVLLEPRYRIFSCHPLASALKGERSRLPM